MIPVTADDHQVPEDAAAPREIRPWAVRAVALLLLFQAVGLFGIALTNFLALGAAAREDGAGVVQLVADFLSHSVVISGLALLALVAGIAFLGLWRVGWVLGMLTQGANLLAGLLLYFDQRRWFVYPLLVFAIFMVLYLYHPDVQDTFELKAIPDEDGEGA